VNGAAPLRVVGNAGQYPVRRQDSVPSLDVQLVDERLGDGLADGVGRRVERLAQLAMDDQQILGRWQPARVGGRDAGGDLGLVGPECLGLLA